MYRVTLAGTYPKEALRLFSSALPDDFVIDCVETQEALDTQTQLQFLVLRTLKVNRRLIENNTGLELIHRWGVGYDTVDVACAAERGIKVAITTGVNANAVAELALTFMLALYRHIIPMHRKTAAGEWDRTSHAADSYTVRNKVVGLIGCGNIGRNVAQKVTALGATVQYYDMFRMDIEREIALGVYYTPLEDLLKTSDIISLHLPLNKATVGIIGEKQLALMKPNAILINTARGGLIDEAALYNALCSGRILGCAMDSYAVEPYDDANGLGQLDNVILTPHMGGTVSDLTGDMVKKIADNILKVALKQPLDKGDWVNANP